MECVRFGSHELEDVGTVVVVDNRVFLEIRAAFTKLTAPGSHMLAAGANANPIFVCTNPFGKVYKQR